MKFLGVDPGASGGAAIITAKHQVVSTIRFKETEADISRWFHEEVCSSLRPGAIACIERVHSMPKQGVASSFKFGRSYGFLRGMLIAHGIRFEAVTPQTWQKALGCRSGGDKNVTKAKAQELFPQVKMTHAIADALLLAEFCRRRETR